MGCFTDGFPHTNRHAWCTCYSVQSPVVMSPPIYHDHSFQIVFDPHPFLIHKVLDYQAVETLRLSNSVSSHVLYIGRVLHCTNVMVSKVPHPFTFPHLFLKWSSPSPRTFPTFIAAQKLRICNDLVNKRRISRKLRLNINKIMTILKITTRNYKTVLYTTHITHIRHTQHPLDNDC